MSCTITATEFKSYFDRGQFTYGTTLPSVRDKDIDSAIAEMEAVINQDLYPTEAICQQAKLYLTAHFLQNDTDASDSGGQPNFIQNSRSADGISESVSIPDWMNKNEFAFYATTYYGQKWLMLTKPYIDGAVYVVTGATQP
jgi:hypothetical protein